MDRYSKLSQRLSSLNRYISHKEAPLLVHRLHDYPARFLPQIARVLIETLSGAGDLVVDPMMGSGTVVEAALRFKRRAFGSDLNPVSCLIASFLSPRMQDIRQAAESFAGEMSRGIGRGEAAGVDLPTKAEFHNWRLWYRPGVLKELIYISRRISDIGDNHCRLALKLALSRICREVSNADPRDLFPQRDKTMPVRPRADVGGKFAKSLKDIFLEAERYEALENEPLLALADARAVPLAPATADLIVFSPPYSYALEYVRVHQLSLSVLGYTRKELREARRLYLGTDKIKSSSRLPDDFKLQYTELTAKAKIRDDKWKRFFLFFACGMLDVIKECRRILRPGCHLAIVAGDTTVRGSSAGTIEIIKMFCRDEGFELLLEHERPYFRRRLNPNRNTHASKVKSDVVLVFKIT